MIKILLLFLKGQTPSLVCDSLSSDFRVCWFILYLMYVCSSERERERERESVSVFTLGCYNSNHCNIDRVAMAQNGLEEDCALLWFVCVT